AGGGHHLLRRRGFGPLHGGSANGGRLPRALTAMTDRRGRTRCATVWRTGRDVGRRRGRPRIVAVEQRATVGDRLDAAEPAGGGHHLLRRGFAPLHGGSANGGRL